MVSIDIFNTIDVKLEQTFRKIRSRLIYTHK